MTEQELQAVLQSDMKLWEQAETNMIAGGGLKKSLFLPYNIGLYNITFTGVTDAGKRRAAAEAWGAAIRGAVEEAIGEEAVTARAAQSAAKASAPADTGNDGHGTDLRSTAAVVSKEAISTYGENLIPSTDDIIGRIDELRDSIIRHRKALSKYELELKALMAFQEVLNAATTPTEDTEKMGEAG